MPRRKTKKKGRLNAPEGVFIEILSRLPVKTLLRFKSVCKAWRTLIEEPFFVQEHLKQLQQGGANSRLNNIMFLDDKGRLCSLDIESSPLSCRKDQIKVRRLEYLPRFLQHGFLWLGSCNGLVCIQLQTTSKDLALLNPCTRTYTKLLTNYHLPGVCQFSYTTAFGFGYDAKIKDYKLVRITSFWPPQFYFSQVHVLTLRTNAWRRLPDVPYHAAGPYYDGSVGGKLVNGALHWTDNYQKLVFCFDAEEEEFKVMCRQIYKSTGEVDWVQIAELGGCLALLFHKKRSDVEVWVMKEYGLEDTWIKMFSIDPRRLSPPDDWLYGNITPICILENNEGILFQIDSNLVLYKPKVDRYEHFHGVSLSPSKSTATYKGSLIYLDQNY